MTPASLRNLLYPPNVSWLWNFAHHHADSRGVPCLNQIKRLPAEMTAEGERGYHPRGGGAAGMEGGHLEGVPLENGAD